MMLDRLQQLGRAGIGFFERLGRAHLFLIRTLAGVPGVLLRPSLVIKQLYMVGVLTLLIILVSGFFVGMVLGLQGYNTLSDFGAEFFIIIDPGQIINLLGSNVFNGIKNIIWVIAPRFLAGFISMPMLAAIFSLVGVYGGYFVGVGLLGVDDGAFWSQMQDRVDLHDDILNGVIKSFVFGFVAVWIAVFEGYDSVPTSEGVSRATTRTVVHTSLVVLGLDFILTALMFGD